MKSSARCIIVFVSLVLSAVLSIHVFAAKPLKPKKPTTAPHLHGRLAIDGKIDDGVLEKAPVTHVVKANMTFGPPVFTSNFDNARAPGWRAVAGSQWSFLHGRMGDLSDSTGPGNNGNWVSAGDPGWTDMRLDADMTEEMDGMGSVFLAVRFQDPRNYYALEWEAGLPKDALRLIRCKDGIRYKIAELSELTLKPFPFRLGLAISGDKLVGYLNDKPVITAFVGDFAVGSVGLGEMTRKVLMDNVSVRPVTSAPALCKFLRKCRFIYALTPRYFPRETGILEIPYTLENTDSITYNQVNVSLTVEDTAAEPGITRELAPVVEKKNVTLAPGAKETVKLILDTRQLKSGEYLIRAKFTSSALGISRDEVTRIGIARTWNPERFNYFAWGLPGDDENLKDYAAHGHTMGIGDGRATPEDWKFKGNAVPPEAQPKILPGQGVSTSFHPFDMALKYGLIAGANLQTTSGTFPKEVYGKTSEGKPTTLPLPYNPDFRTFSINLARTYAKKYGVYPAFRMMNMNTETEYENQPDISDLGLARMKAEYGLPFPSEAADMLGLPYDKVKDMVKDGVVSDDHPLVKFYRWYWLRGEGYNVLDREMADAIHAERPDMFVFHDPAARMPSVRDRNDGLYPWDWTYTTPNALTLPYKIEALRAISKLGTDQVCNYVQVLWKAQVIGDIDLCPSASIIRLGLLHSMSRPVKAVGHWNTDWMREPQHSDRWDAVKDLYETLWKPLGPVFTSLGVPKRKVAFLVSSTNELFCVKVRSGGWIKDSAFAAWHEAFMRANIPVDVVYEEDAVDGKLKQYDALFIPFGELIARSAYDRIVEFANDGKLVVADKYLGYHIPNVVKLAADMDFALYPNWAYSSVSAGTGVNAEEFVKKEWAAVDEIISVFAKQRTGPTSEEKWLVITPREWDGVPYLFAVNDKRVAGEIGTKYKTILEQGIPLNATIQAPFQGTAPVIYDLTAHSIVETRQTGQSLAWTSDFDPASARLYAMLPKPIALMEVTTPDAVKRGESMQLLVRILDSDGMAIHGLAPIRLTIHDARGALSEYSDTFAVKNGFLSIPINTAVNDVTGLWSVKVDDLASGKVKNVRFTVK